MFEKRLSAASAARLATIAALALFVAVPATADAREVTRQTTKQRTENGYTRDSVMTGPEGRQATRSATVVNDKEAGTRTRSVVRQGPEGRQRTVKDQLQRTENGYTRSKTATNPNGAVNTRNVVASYDPETGTRSKEVTRERTPPAGSDK